VVEDDDAAAETLIRGLRRHGYDADRVETGTDALKAFRRADLVLLDLELPDLDGLEVCRGIRAASDTPIIAVTERGTELDRVLGLQAGSDDCLDKPFGFRELMARIEAVMRRVRPRTPGQRIIAHGPLYIDSGAREVSLNDRLIAMTRKEFDLLHLLASQPETVVPRTRIMSEVWNDDWTKTGRTIDTHVNSLRNKLGDSRWIITVRGVGFRLGRGPATEWPR
jgi:DNA-binding response OmpR family regulator